MPEHELHYEVQREVRELELPEETFVDVQSTNAHDKEQANLIESITDKEFSPELKPSREEKTKKIISLDPNLCTTHVNQRKKIRYAEFQYFTKMNRVKMFNIGVDRMSENPALAGTQVAAVSDDLAHFAVAGQSATV